MARHRLAFATVIGIAMLAAAALLTAPDVTVAKDQKQDKESASILELIRRYPDSRQARQARTRLGSLPVPPPSTPSR